MMMIGFFQILMSVVTYIMLGITVFIIKTEIKNYKKVAQMLFLFIFNTPSG